MGKECTLHSFDSFAVRPSGQQRVCPTGPVTNGRMNGNNRIPPYYRHPPRISTGTHCPLVAASSASVPSSLASFPPPPPSFAPALASCFSINASKRPGGCTATTLRTPFKSNSSLVAHRKSHPASALIELPPHVPRYFLSPMIGWPSPAWQRLGFRSWGFVLFVSYNCVAQLSPTRSKVQRFAPLVSHTRAAQLMTHAHASHSCMRVCVCAR